MKDLYRKICATILNRTWWKETLKNWFIKSKENLTSKVWWKSQMKVRDKMLFLYGFWICYGGWLLMTFVGYAFFEIPVNRYNAANGFFIGLMWFFFYCLNIIEERSLRKIYMDFNEYLIQDHQAVLDGWKNSNDVAYKLLARVKELEAKYEPKNDSDKE